MSEEARSSADTMTDGFADLVCADPLLLRAEFDALIAASWDSEPPTPPTGTRTLVGVVDPDWQPGEAPLGTSVRLDHARVRCESTSKATNGRLRHEADASQSSWDPSMQDGSHDGVRGSAGSG